jgi:hypothetical protein
LIGDRGGSVGYIELIELVIKEPSIKRGKGGREKRYTKTIERSIGIMNKLGIITRFNDTIELNSYGKVLYELIKNRNLEEESLEIPEKLFYFIILFSQPVALQLTLLLKSIKNNEGASRDKIIRNYIELLLSLPSNIEIFDRIYLRECLQNWDTRGKFPLGIINKFECMRGWLKDLGLIKIKGLELTISSKKILEKISGTEGNLEIPSFQMVKENVVKLSQLVLNPTSSFPLFDEADTYHTQIFNNLFLEAYRKFYCPSIKMSDVVAIRTWIIIQLLISKNIILELKDFDKYLEKQVKEGILKSVSKNDKGELGYVEA